MTVKSRVLRYLPTESRGNRELHAPELRRSLDALTIGGAVFLAEQWVQKKIRITRLEVPLYDKDAYDTEKLATLVHDVLLYALVEDIPVKIVGRRFSANIRKRFPAEPTANICLFSGGVDSLSGVLLAEGEVDDLQAVFCAHDDQARVIAVVESLRKTVLDSAGVTLHKVSVPGMGSSGYVQLRGFLYCLASAAWIARTGARRLIVTESGPTMYQPRFSPFDAITMTTHPAVLRYAEECIRTLLERPVTIITPFENLTKAEVMAVCPQKDALPLTHSCISQRFGDHDGTCYGCVIRRLAAITARVPDVVYNRDPLTDDTADGNNLMSLLNYCHDILVDYDGMEEFELEKIRRYRKRDLFKRFALDQYAALYQLITDGYRLRSSIPSLYESVRRKIGRPVLKKRLAEVRSMRPTIDLTRKPPR